MVQRNRLNEQKETQAMRNLIVTSVLVVGLTASAATVHAQNPGRRMLGGMAARGAAWNAQMAQTRPWHGGYYYLPTGAPVAMVVPPNAVMQQNYSWGVSQNTMTPIPHQYTPELIPGIGGPFYATPPWPSHTRQFGVYPVRAPW
ncbi:MAG: hypothetical protein D6753_03865 [Planctomycetota bacterium]|nr:MAG: hypothetical protein D6753_03865 [Planctomycetota bacterium]